MNPPALSKNKKAVSWFHIVFLVLISTLGTLVAAEAVLQAFDIPKQSWSPWVADEHTGFRYASHLKQRMITKDYDAFVITNAEGLRDDPVGPKKGTRILLLGDSYTFGYGVDRPHIFADLLEKKLGVEIVNAGTGGFDIIHQVQFMKYYGAKFKPDLVIYMLYLGNDLSRNDRWRLRDGNLIANDRPTVRSHRDVKLLTLLKILRHRIWFKTFGSREFFWKLPPDFLAMTARDLAEPAKKDYQLTFQLLAQLATEVEAAGSKFLLVLTPYATMVEKEAVSHIRRKIETFDLQYDLDRPRREITSWAERKHLMLFDLTDRLRTVHERENRRLYFEIDGHFNLAGHQAVAEILASFLKERFPLLLKKDLEENVRA